MRPRKQTDTPTHKHHPNRSWCFSAKIRHHARVCRQEWVHPVVSFLCPGSSKKQPSRELTHHRGHAPDPQFNVFFWILSFGGLQKSQFSAPPITPLKLVGSGVSNVSLYFFCGWLFFWRTWYIFIFKEFFRNIFIMIKRKSFFFCGDFHFVLRLSSAGLPFLFHFIKKNQNIFLLTKYVFYLKLLPISL